MIDPTSRGLPSATATQLMPFAGVIATSLTGSAVASVLPDRRALWTVVASYAFWGLGMTGTLMILTTWFQRLILHGMPPRKNIPAMFLPVAPLSLGALS